MWDGGTEEDVNAWIALLLLDSDVHARLEWELAIFTLCGTAFLGAISWIVVDLIMRSRRTRRTLHKTVVRQGQHEEQIVQDLRNGQPFPNLTPDLDDEK